MTRNPYVTNMMKKSVHPYLESYSLVVRFFCDLCKELNYHGNTRKYLTSNEYQLLKAYYHELNYKTVEHVAHWRASQLQHVAKHIMSYKKPPWILDAGCGLGSELIFFSLLGAKVVGIDINRERLHIAKKRVEYYEEKYNRLLHVEFLLKSILEFCEYEEFNLVWSNQSISHIHPIEDFLKVAWGNLKDGGHLIICDSNNLNPYISFQAWLVHHKGGLYTVVEDPNTSEPVPYARENYVNPLLLKSLLRKFHYDIRLVKYHGFMPPRFSTKVLRFIEKTLASIPFICLAAGSYIVIGKKVK